MSAGPQRADQLEPTSSPLDRLDAVAEELGVEADLERLAANGAGSDSRASPTSCVCAETVSSPSAKRSRSGELRCAITDDAADDLEQLVARQRRPRARTPRAAAACSSGTGRRCGASSATTSSAPKTTWFSCTPSSSSSSPRRDAARARRARAPGRSPRAPATSPVDRGLLHRQPVRVGRGHHELAALEADEDAGQHRARLVARRRAADARDRLEQRLARRRVKRRGVDLGQPREVLGRVRVQPVARRAARRRATHALLGAVLDRDLARRAAGATMSTSSRPGHDDGALALDLRVERRAQRELHVGRGERRARRPAALQQDAGEDLHRRSASTRRATTTPSFATSSSREHVSFIAGPTTAVCCHVIFKNLVVVIGSVDDGEDVPQRVLAERFCAVGRGWWRIGGFAQGGRGRGRWTHGFSAPA